MEEAIRALESQLKWHEHLTDELLAALKALADKVDATGECDHKRISCEDIGCIGVEVRRARSVIAKAAGAEQAG
jgi:hypothetical protein